MDQAAAAILSYLQTLGLPPMEQVPVAQLRTLYPPALPDATDELAVQSFEDVTIRGPAGALPVRIYRPKAKPRGVIVYFHGGGFVIGSVASCHASVCAIVARTDFVIVSVEYRLAPEAPFPAAVEDAFAAVSWAHNSRQTLAGFDAPVIVAGESAGANLAAVAALLARDAGIEISLQLLFYPITDAVFETPSYISKGNQMPLTRAAMIKFWDDYVADPATRLDWRAAPLRAKILRGVAPAYVAVAGYDPLYDEGKAYANRLAAEDVAVVCDDCTSLVHGFIAMMGQVPAARAAVNRACAFLKDHLSQRSGG